MVITTTNNIVTIAAEEGDGGYFFLNYNKGETVINASNLEPGNIEESTSIQYPSKTQFSDLIFDYFASTNIQEMQDYITNNGLTFS